MSYIFKVSALFALVLARDATAFTEVLVPSFEYIPNTGSLCGSPQSQVTVRCLKECFDECGKNANCNYVVYREESTSSSETCYMYKNQCYSGSYRTYQKKETLDRVCTESLRDYNLHFIVDESGSVGTSNFKRMQQFMVDITSTLSLNPEKTLEHMLVATFSGKLGETYKFTPGQYCKFEDDIWGHDYTSGQTNIYDGLLYAKTTIQTDNNFKNKKNIVVLLTDGEPTRWGTGGNIYKTNVEEMTIKMAKELTALDNTFLIYARIKNANAGLFSSVPNTVERNVGNWKLNEFAQELNKLIGEVICSTNAPTKSPTVRPTSNAPTPSPSKSPSVSPTMYPTTLAPSTCTVIDSGEESISLAETDDFVTSLGVEISNAITLGSNATTYASTYAFHKSKQNLVGGFITSFTVTLDDIDNTQGFAFVLHRAPEGLTNIPGAIGSGLGYANIPNSIAIVFDFCTNRFLDRGSCYEEELTLEFAPYLEGSTPPLDRQIIKDFISRRETFQVRVEYLEQSSLLRVYVDDELMIEQWEIRAEEITGGVESYVGFTASYSEVAHPIEITDWRFLTVPIDYNNTYEMDLVPDSAPRTLVADGQSWEGFSIQPRDFCKYDITYGGYGDLMDALFVEVLDEETGSYLVGGSTPDIVKALVVDNEDGTYTAALQTTNANVSYALFAAYGKDCKLEVKTAEDPSRGVQIPSVGLDPSSPSGECFFSYVSKAIETIPPPPKPDVPPASGTDPNLDQDDTNIAAIAAGGGAAAVALVAAAFVMQRYRKKWQSDKNFIEDGKIANLEKDVQYADDAALGAVGGKLMSTRQAILREKKQVEKLPKTGEIAQLEQERNELQEMLRENKKNMQMSTPTSLESENPTFGQTQRKEFGGGVV